VGQRRSGEACKTQIESFREHLEDKELSDNTVRAYITAMEQFFSSFVEISKKNGLDWKRELQEKGLKAKSINIKLNAFNSFCGMVHDDGSKVKTMRVHQATAVSNVISEQDYKKLLDGLKNDGNMRWYYNIKLLASTGARVSEYVRLKKTDFSRGYAEMWTKGKIRRIYIPKSFLNEADGYYSSFEPDDFLAVGRDGGQITTRGVSQMLMTFAARYGIDKKVMHPHSFRHMFAIQFLRRNNNLSLLADVLGHSSVSTTAIYTRMTKEQQQDAVNKTINW
jgi:site-specific recombinase XerD